MEEIVTYLLIMDYLVFKRTAGDASMAATAKNISSSPKIQKASEERSARDATGKKVSPKYFPSFVAGSQWECVCMCMCVCVVESGERTSKKDERSAKKGRIST
jgi:hypothetical protein